MEKFLWIFGSLWVMLAFLFVFALAAAARKRVLTEKEMSEAVKRALKTPSMVSPPRPETLHPVHAVEPARA